MPSNEQREVCVYLYLCEGAGLKRELRLPLHQAPPPAHQPKSRHQEGQGGWGGWGGGGGSCFQSGHLLREELRVKVLSEWI